MAKIAPQPSRRRILFPCMFGFLTLRQSNFGPVPCESSGDRARSSFSVRGRLHLRVLHARRFPRGKSRRESRRDPIRRVRDPTHRAPTLRVPGPSLHIRSPNILGQSPIPSRSIPGRRPTPMHRRPNSTPGRLNHTRTERRLPPGAVDRRQVPAPPRYTDPRHRAPASRALARPARRNHSPGWHPAPSLVAGAGRQAIVGPRQHSMRRSPRSIRRRSGSNAREPRSSLGQAAGPNARLSISIAPPPGSNGRTSTHTRAMAEARATGLRQPPLGSRGRLSGPVASP
jgi:hypothetical protein